MLVLVEGVGGVVDVGVDIVVSTSTRRSSIDTSISSSPSTSRSSDINTNYYILATGLMKIGNYL